MIVLGGLWASQLAISQPVIRRALGVLMCVCFDELATLCQFNSFWVSKSIEKTISAWGWSIYYQNSVTAFILMIFKCDLTNVTMFVCYSVLRHLSLTYSVLCHLSLTYSVLCHLSLTYSVLCHLSLTYSVLCHLSLTYSVLCHLSLTYSVLCHLSLTYSVLCHLSMTYSVLCHLSLTYSVLRHLSLTCLWLCCRLLRCFNKAGIHFA